MGKTRMAARPSKAADTDTYAGRFAARIRSLREKAGKTVEQVAEEIGVSGKTVYNWEAGLRQPPLDYLPALATAFKLKTVRAVLPEN